MHPRPIQRWLAAGVVLATLALPAQAYIGPGAGFAAAGSLLVLLGTFFLAFGIIAIWPFKVVIRAVTGKKRGPSKYDRVVVIGLDGFDPRMARKLMAAGRLPNLSKLAERGFFSDLDTACPSISPVAWSTFATGTDASRHNIYDFLTRDPCSYAPILSSSDIRAVPKTLNLGLAEIPLGTKFVYRSLQKSQPFWKLLGDTRVWSSIIRVPITFPPQPFKNGTLLSGMCVPDLQGTQGSFSFYSTKQRPAGAKIGGQQFQVVVRKGRVESNLVGPAGKDGHHLKCPFVVELDEKTRKARVTVGTETVEVGAKEYTPWLVASFGGVTGIVRFYVQTWEGAEFELYATPVQINPDDPAMPISHPFVYSIYLAKTLGQFGTLGLAEDTWALNERVIDEEAFLKQAWFYYEERRKQLFDALDKTKKGFVTVVFDTSDRVSHMFWRTLDPTHPANPGKEVERWKDVIPETYAKMDGLVGEVVAELGDDPRTMLMVISDHGFTNFRRGVNLNTWLKDNGYLFLKAGHETSADWFAQVDWSRTKAFTLGLTGVFVNRKGREAQGIVEKRELDALCHELKTKLEALRDPVTGEPVIREVFLTREIHSGPYADAAPELLIGYHEGFRHSWDCATGSVSREVFTDNTKSWSGDHCVDPRLVPGVFYCDRKPAITSPALVDIAPTVLDLFGLEIPAYMQGRALFADGTEKRAKPGRGLDVAPPRGGHDHDHGHGHSHEHAFPRASSDTIGAVIGGTTPPPDSAARKGGPAKRSEGT
ncbi:MAG: alkaline phosphatase family protein [Planctomycetota bacterium]|nr:alkaline phosphatase family protein [Planctomycetota bacterium]